MNILSVTAPPGTRENYTSLLTRLVTALANEMRVEVMCVKALRACTPRAMLSLFTLPPKRLDSRETTLSAWVPAGRGHRPWHVASLTDTESE